MARRQWHNLRQSPHRNRLRNHRTTLLNQQHNHPRTRRRPQINRPTHKMGLSIQTRRTTTPLYKALPRQKPKTAAFCKSTGHSRTSKELRSHSHGCSKRLLGSNIHAYHGNIKPTIRRKLYGNDKNRIRPYGSCCMV